ncbi:RNA 2'-phosphotransferase [Runella sp. MFBS21]|uniref:RNA 2'-phosphotransferase n=1 Tax=Runella sp. MFBS21 TaxID=3034018 RepID=UPI0023F84FF6|nr:RNA 2'-phosphotransferase [Runella sp. MFBS21]MDF7821003.1 RNA 2'-phosphotransferase [Runella sp. MFBS21]
MKDEFKTSKFLSLILRHRPDLVDLEMDKNGWVSVEELLAKTATKGHPLTFEELKHLVLTNNKQRFAFSQDFQKIRANQGHSIEVDLAYDKQLPPSFLYHGTAEKNLSSILKQGIQKRNRHHVHLSVDKATAYKVGIRHGKPSILKINTKLMSEAGIAFYLSSNGVWLTDFVAPAFIEIEDSEQ